MRHRRGLAAGLSLVLAVLAACTAGDRAPVTADRAPPSPPASDLPGRPTSPPLPVYGGPPPDGPPSAGPLTTVRGAVDLTPAIPGYFSRAEAAVPAPDGGAYVVVTPEQPGTEPQLVTVAGATFTIVRSVPLPGIADVSSLHLLTDGTLAVTGRLQPAGVPRGGYGFHVVDPVTGAARTTSFAYGEGAVSSFVRSALAPDGRTLYLFLSVVTQPRIRERLLAVDALSGAVLAEQLLGDDVAAVSRTPAGSEVAGLIARPGGGVTLAFDATPDAATSDRVPTLLTFDARLEPVGAPVEVTTLSEGGETQAVTATPDGTVFLVVEVTEGAWILAVPDGGGAGPVLVQLADHLYDYALAVEPAQLWGVLPAYEGARAVDLTTGELRGPVDVGCPGQDVRAIVPVPDGALLLGECNSPRTRTQMLWFVGPRIGP
jgi:hypothetical protein